MRQPDGVRLAAHLSLLDIPHLEAGVVFLHVGFNLLTQVAHDEDEFNVIGVRQGFEGIQDMVEHGFASHAQQLLGPAPCMRAQARPKASHWNNDF